MKSRILKLSMVFMIFLMMPHPTGAQTLSFEVSEGDTMTFKFLHVNDNGSTSFENELLNEPATFELNEEFYAEVTAVNEENVTLDITLGGSVYEDVTDHPFVKKTTTDQNYWLGQEGTNVIGVKPSDYIEINSTYDQDERLFTNETFTNFLIEDTFNPGVFYETSVLERYTMDIETGIVERYRFENIEIYNDTVTYELSFEIELQSAPDDTEVAFVPIQLLPIITSFTAILVIKRLRNTSS